jgi:hypothetical protein
MGGENKIFNDTREVNNTRDWSKTKLKNDLLFFSTKQTFIQNIENDEDGTVDDGLYIKPGVNGKTLTLDGKMKINKSLNLKNMDSEPLKCTTSGANKLELDYKGGDLDWVIDTSGGENLTFKCNTVYKEVSTFDGNTLFRQTNQFDGAVILNDTLQTNKSVAMSTFEDTNVTMSFQATDYELVPVFDASGDPPDNSTEAQERRKTANADAIMLKVYDTSGTDNIEKKLQFSYTPVGGDGEEDDHPGGEWVIKTLEGDNPQQQSGFGAQHINFKCDVVFSGSVIQKETTKVVIETIFEDDIIVRGRFAGGNAYHDLTRINGGVVNEHDKFVNKVDFHNNVCFKEGTVAGADVSAASLVTIEGNTSIEKDLTVEGDVRVKGNLNIDGHINRTDVDVNNLSVHDNILTINSGVKDMSFASVSNRNLDKPGIRFETGNERQDCILRWNDSVKQLEVIGCNDLSDSYIPSGFLDVHCKTIQTSSDLRLKENIMPVVNSKELINKMNPVYWKWKDSHERSCGLIAQDILKISPDAVGGSGDSLALNYNYFIGLLISRMKEMEQEMDAFREKL